MLLATLSQLSLSGSQVSATASQVVNSAYDISGGGARKLVRLSNGWLVATLANGSNNQYWYVSKDNGLTWSQLCYQTGISVNGSGIAMVSSGTMVYTIATGSNQTALFCYAFDATTVSNTAISPVSTTVDSVQNAFSGVSLVIDGTGTLHAVWASKNGTYPNSFNLRYSKSTDGGNTWAAPTQITAANTSGTDNTYPCIVVRSNNYPTIVYQTNVSGTYYINTAFWNGAAWVLQGSSAVYNGGSYFQASPCAAVDGNDVIHVVWHGTDATNGQTQIKYSKSTDGGNTWSAVTNLTNTGSYGQFYPSITIDSNNNLYVLFNGIDVAVTASYQNIRRIVYSGGSWGSITTLTNNTTANAQYAQTLWSKFNMNSSDAVRFIYQDNQAVRITYDQSPRLAIPVAPLQVPNAPSQVVNTAYDTSGNGGRKLVQLSNGWLVAATNTGPYGNMPTFYVSKDNGCTWGQLTYVNSSASNPQVAIAAQGTRVYALVIYAGGSTTVNCYSFDATTVGTSLNSAVAVDVQTSIGSGCSLVIDGNGTLHAVWCSKNSTYPNSLNIRYSKSTDGGNTWTTPTQITTNNSSGQDNTNPCIVVRSNNYPTIFWQNQTSGGIYCANWTGSAWSGLISVYTPSSSSYTQSNPCAAVDGNDVIHVVWHGYDATYPSVANIRYSKSTDGGNTWSAMTLLTTGNSYNQYNPSITIDGNNNLYVFFNGIDQSVSTSANNIRKIVNNGSWGSVTTITNNTTTHAQFAQTLWSKFNMNSSDAVRFIYQDNQAGQITYDQSPRGSATPSNVVAEEKILLWSANGTNANTTQTAAGNYTIQEGTAIITSANGIGGWRLHTLNANWPPNTQFALEVTVQVTSGSTVYAGLDDDTSGTPYNVIPGSQVSASTLSFTTVRSGKFTLTPGHSYKVAVWVNNGTGYITDASLIVFP